MTEELKERIKALADKYETSAFLRDDPSQFMHRYTDVRDKEVAAFIAANLAFGNRAQILAHCEVIFASMRGESPADWVANRGYGALFPDESAGLDGERFYRMYTKGDMRLFFDALSAILQQGCSLGEYFYRVYSACVGAKDYRVKPDNDTPKGCFEAASGGKTASGCVIPALDAGIYDGVLLECIKDAFPKECHLIAHSKDGAAKKLNMLLRWLVRDNSSVDLGLWTWYDKRKLLIPLDTHVMSVARSLGLITSRTANLKTAVALTDAMREVFPDDPARADFALFGLGVNSDFDRAFGLWQDRDVNIDSLRQTAWK